MAGFTHLSVALAAKPMAQKVPLWILIVAAYTIDIVWFGFFLAGVEHFPSQGISSLAPWSHGLFMALVWSLLATLIVLMISRNRKISAFLGLLVFSHWVIDFIAKPMLFSFPQDTGVTIFFDPAKQIGLGWWSTQWGMYIGEYVTLIIAAAIYISFLMRKKRERKSLKAVNN